MPQNFGNYFVFHEMKKVENLRNSSPSWMVVCDLTTAHILDLPSEARRAPTWECKPAAFKVPESFLNCLRDLSSCFLKDITGKERNRRRA